MKFFSAVTALAVATCSSTLACATPVKGQSPVCVVGAGPAGLVAANHLEAKGYDVVVFERKAAVGGQVQTYYADDGTFHPLGALLFSNATYVEALKVIAQTDVQALPFVEGPRYQFNITSGEENPAPPFPADFQTVLAVEVQRYVTYWSTLWQPYNKIRYTTPVPPELQVTCAEWLSQNGYVALPVLFVEAMVPFGYGNYKDMPIIYMLSYLTPDILGFFIQQHGAYVIDFHKVFVEYANTIKGPIRTSTQITKIDRTGDNPVIYYNPDVTFSSTIYTNTTTADLTPRSNTTTPSPLSQSCSSVVLAFPPTVSSLSAAGLSLSDDETAVFSPIKLNGYYSAAVNMPEVPFNISFAALSDSPTDPVAAVGEPVYFLKIFPQSPLVTSWSWATVPDAKSGYALLKSTLSLVNKDPLDPDSVATEVTDDDVKGFTAPDYFPHWSAADIQNGIYEKYNALQGQQNTYYTSAANGFEVVEFALRGGVDIVESFF